MAQGKKIADLLALMSSLRDPDTGCPWDKAQTFETIVPHTIEEAYEVADAIESGSVEDIRDELGDLLFQVVFYAQIAQEKSLFDFDDVVAGITDKMTRRHPHVFAQTKIDNVDEQSRLWNEIKSQENQHKVNGDESKLDGIVTGLPATVRAKKLQGRAARSGFDWPDSKGVFEKLDEELNELNEAITQGNQSEIENEMGDVLFVCINLCRHLKVDPDTAIRSTSRKFEQRFRLMEKLAMQTSERLEELSLDEQEGLWQDAKQKLAQK